MNIDRMIDLLKNHIPEAEAKQIASAFVLEYQEQFDRDMEAFKKSYLEENHFEQKLAELTAKFDEERKEMVEATEEGYAEAYKVITEMKEKFVLQKAEYEEALAKNYREAEKLLEDTMIAAEQ